MKAGPQRATSKIPSSVIILSLQTFVTLYARTNYQVMRNFGTDLSLFPKRLATVRI
jgi:hypothetical protein